MCTIANVQYAFRWLFTFLLFILTRYVKATERIQLEAKTMFGLFVLCLMVNARGASVLFNLIGAS